MKIAVYGASGHTGRFVMAELLRRGHIPIAVGRDEAKVQAAAAQVDVGVETRIAELDAPARLDDALRGAEAVIHCAGPFLDTARPLIEAALRVGTHYLDVTAEQGSALSTFESYDKPARDRGICVVPAAGFYGGLGDLLATSAMHGCPCADRIDIAIALDSWHPTLGTRRTGQRNTAPRLALCGGKLTQLQPSGPISWSFPVPFGTQDVIEIPFTETILLHRHLGVREIHSYLNQAPLRDLRNPKTPAPVVADECGRSNQRFVVDVTVQNGDDRRRITASGYDIYAVTAPIIVEAVERICNSSRQNGGAFALGELVDASDYIQALVRRGEIALTIDRKAKVSS